MGIPWEKFKNEIEFQYMVQNHSLEQVRVALLAQGLDASIRAYRNKMEEWGFRKNRRASKPVHDRQRPKRINQITSDSTGQNSALETQQPPSSSNTADASSPQQLVANDSKFGIPACDFKIKDLQALIKDHWNDDHNFEIIISKWQADGEYMKCAQELLQRPKHHVSLTHVTEDGSNLFEFIHCHLGPEERITLTKLFLEHHKRPLTDEEYHPYVGSHWAWAWYTTCRCDSWDTAKEILLSETDDVPNFIDCALVIMAECFSAKLLAKIHDLAEPNFKWPLGAETVVEVGRFRSEILSIFQFFNEEVRVVRPSWEFQFTTLVDLINGPLNIIESRIQESLLQDSKNTAKKLREQVEYLLGDAYSASVAVDLQQEKMIELRSFLEEKLGLIRENRTLIDENIKMKKRDEARQPDEHAIQQEKKLTLYRQIIGKYAGWDEDDVDYQITLSTFTEGVE